MRAVLRVALWLAVVSGNAAPAFAHGIPINLFADASTNSLYTLGTFDNGRFEPSAGFNIATNPSIGVANPGNGLPDEAEIFFEVVSGLLFATPTEVQPAVAHVEVLSPTSDNFGQLNHSPVLSYHVDSTTGPQAGMRWGTYDNITPGWDADGKFVLAPAYAPHGVYGFDIRIASPGYVPTDPISLRFVHDPLMQLKSADIQAAIDLLNASPLVTAPADFDRDGEVDGDDFLVWQANFPSTHAEPTSGDADGDRDVDGDDFLIWQRDYGDLGSASSPPVPEPATTASIVMMVLVLSAPRRGRRERFSAPNLHGFLQ